MHSESKLYKSTQANNAGIMQHMFISAYAHLHGNSCETYDVFNRLGCNVMLPRQRLQCTQETV